ncbi:alpha/beta-hydrolase [Jackrogersella minutella]|nr:alpha/beta-hydrolase [Jackrogersella minutella]
MANTKMSSWLFLAICAGIIPVALGRGGKTPPDGPPTVDLGYEIHQGSVNTTGDFYIFSNVPYAEQPVGELRFQKPVAINNTGSGIINNGLSNGENIVCLQAYPQWIINLMAERKGVDNVTMAFSLTSQPGQTEACLVLDVYIPTNIFDERATTKAPVLVWIHGGGFTFGSKLFYGSPAGLVAQSRRNGEDGIIVVAINYRLGMLGWLAGDGVMPNLGLYDQRLALEWVQQYIALFGGNKDKVTVMGESAGASSIVHHITAYGGGQPAPFQAAIPQSPAFQFNIDPAAGYNKTLAEASKQVGATVGGVTDLRKLPVELLSSINQATVISSAVGTFGFGPGPDGTYVPAIPQVLLYSGKFNHNINLLVSHTTNESVPFLPANISTSSDVRAYVQSSLPEASNATVDALLTNPALYPDVLNGSAAYPWTTQFARAARVSSDLGFACTARYLASARGNPAYDAIASPAHSTSNAYVGTYAYVFGYPPGWHESDVPYVFFDGDTMTPDDGLPVNSTYAMQVQDYIVAFVKYGDPNGGLGDDGGSIIGGKGVPVRFPAYGPEARVLELGYDGFREGVDDLKGQRCEWIQKAMVDGRL